MKNIEKFYEMYDELKELKPDDTFRLMKEAPNKECKDFFEMTQNYFLQKEQSKLISKGVY